MAEFETRAAFAAFREAAFDDFHLLMWLRRPLDRDAYVAEVVKAGAEHGFTFDETAVRAVLRAGEQTWLSQGGDPS